jgi:penicillin-binding protein 1A
MTQRARRRHRRTRRHKSSKILLGLGVVTAILAIGVLSFGLWVLNVAATTPSINSLKAEDKGENSVVLAADGTRLGYINSDVVRTPIPLARVPEQLQEATVAIEDENFYQHDGVDPSAIMRALLKNIEAGEAVQGGSTITQQLVRNLYIAEPEDTLERKIREATLAEDLEEEHSKKWILGQYVNTASYGTVQGRTAVGVEGAAQTFFSKHARELSLEESALLAGLPQAPTAYNPLIDPNAALERRNQVLNAMVEEGYITDGEAAKTKRQGLGLSPGDRYTEIRNPFFFSFVEQELIERYGVNTVRKGGLKVYTSIDPAHQDAAEQAVATGAASLGGPSAAMVSIDPANGNIIAMGSSSNFDSEQYNLAASGNRQPGSAFKPFVLTTAIEQGIDPHSTYYNGSSPITLTLEDGLTTWTVNNAEGGGGGTMSIADGTTHSVNVVFAQLGLDVGPENVADTAHAMGIESPLDGIPAEAIGGMRVGVSPLEMADAYATLAAGGVHHDATAITRVEFPDGETDAPEQEEGKRVMSDGVAYEVTRILETVITSGTGTSASIGCPAAGKTGTTDDYTDAWFVGYTPELAAAVWVGYPDARTSMGTGAYGGTYAAPIWNDYMSVATGGSCEDFPPPENPASYSPFYGSHAVTGKTQDNYSYDSGYGDSGYEDTTTTPAPSGGGGGSDDSYDPDLYAPGAGQEPLPAPPDAGSGGGGGAPPPTGGGGGGSTGGGGTGGGTGGGAGGDGGTGT